MLCKNNDNGRLDIYYDYDGIAENINKKILEKERRFWKYKPLLPVTDDKNIISLGEGFTPLLKSKRIGHKIRLDNLFFKDDTRNPTGSFKDRPITVGVSKAIEFNFEITVSASSGNAAASLAAYSASAGMKCYAFVQEFTSPQKVAQLNMYGSNVIKFKGINSGEDPTVKMLKEVYRKYNWYPCPSFGPFNPYQAEGSKTISYEIAEQLQWDSPNVILVPVGAGGLLAGTWKGFIEFEKLGLISNKPRVVAVQSEGCAPLVDAFRHNIEFEKLSSWRNPKSVASGLLDPLPWDGDAALKALKESGGIALSVSDKEILDAQRMLSSLEGIFAEPSGATALAGLIRMVNERLIDKDESVVVEVTGSGFKDLDIIIKKFGKAPLITASLDELERLIIHR